MRRLTSTQVRCDSNKSGCSRCVDKRLSCQFSESRVGKVVGKRRKRPTDDSIGMVNSSSWIVNSYPATESLPSPATTTSSDDINKRNCTESGWQPTLAPSYQSPSFLPVTEHPIYDYSMSDSRAYSLSSDFSMFSTSGLPTPALSPPQVQYLAPMLLETQSFLQPSTLPSQGRSPYYSVMPTIPTQQQPSSSSRNNTSSSNFVPDDDEMVCIKLLGHLKRQSLNNRASMSLNAVHNLVNNTNAAIRRILNQPSTSDNQSCHLLLSNISIPPCRPLRDRRSSGTTTPTPPAATETKFDITSASLLDRSIPITVRARPHGRHDSRYHCRP